MVLCFGTFASILNQCRLNMPQEKFVSRIAWVVDRRNSSLGSEIDFDVEDPADIDGNKPVVTRLLSCQRPFVLRDKQFPSLRTAKQRFASQVLPFIKENSIAKALLAVLYVIQYDSTIENGHAATFKENLGVSKDKLLTLTKFNAPDFFARVLRYTTYIDNKAEPPDKIKIKKDFIDNAVNESWAELRWDADTQTVEVIPSEEKCLRDEIDRLSELRLALMEEPAGYTYTDWLDVDKSFLFPNCFSQIKFESPEMKALVSKKMVRYAKLVHEFTDCLIATQRSDTGQRAKWPIFPDEKLRGIRQQLTLLSDELFALGIFSEHLYAEQELEEITLDGE